jgi:beta-glucanase (GH16 family)
LTKHKLQLVAVALFCLGSGACGTEQGAPAEAIQTDGTSGLTWAVNVGGPAYEGIDGTMYEAEASVSGGSVAYMNTVKGSQDPFLYKTYRVGDIEIAHPLPSGDYEVTLHFAEPDDIGGGERVFDIVVEGKPVLKNLDVMAFRDGKVKSALTVTVPDIAISDGELNVAFSASVNEAVLSAILVRSKSQVINNWQLVWNDEFDVDGEPDPSKWSADIWPARKVNDEDQAYTARAKNVRVENGFLILTAHKEDYDDAKYTSGRIHSSGKGDFLYGRFEVRAKLPAGKGSWPAIWMLPSDPFRYATTCEAGEDWQGSSTCNAWPNSGEIDIMEHVGYQMNHIHGTVHNEAYYWAKWEQRKGRIIVDGVDEDFHVYALEWTPEEIRAYVDDALYFVYVNEESGWESWPYDQPFHLILNVAVGGMWGRSGGGIDDDIFPLSMLVDYARVYQLAE